MQNLLSQNPNIDRKKGVLIMILAIIIFLYSGNDILRNFVSNNFSNFKTTDWLWFGSTCTTLISSIGLFFQKKWGVILFTLATLPIFYFFFQEMNNPLCKQENEGVLFCMFLLVTITPYVAVLLYIWAKWKKFN